jgi:hypothetical protein
VGALGLQSSLSRVECCRGRGGSSAGGGGCVGSVAPGRESVKAGWRLPGFATCIIPYGVKRNGGMARELLSFCGGWNRPFRAGFGGAGRRGFGTEVPKQRGLLGSYGGRNRPCRAGSGGAGRRGFGTEVPKQLGDCLVFVVAGIAHFAPVSEARGRRGFGTEVPKQLGDCWVFMVAGMGCLALDLEGGGGRRSLSPPSADRDGGRSAT